MILEAEKRDVQIAGEFKTSAFKIKASAKAFDILSSKIYTNKVAAVIREICCNAHDAHVTAGNDNPYDVHLPTHLEPWFSVRDYGTGLSDEDVREIFSTYFCSTKTHSNELTGALGLGSKVPLSMVDSFSVKSYYGGTLRTYSCFLNQDGEPKVALLSEVPTSEHNGLEVTLCVNNKEREFREEAVEIFTYFDKIPNINDPSVEKSVKEKRDAFIFTGDDFGFASNWGNCYAVMGGVRYEIPRNLVNIDCAGYLKFPIGSLSFDAGRESLTLDDKTIASVKKKWAEVRGKLNSLIVSKIESFPAPFEKAREAKKYGSISSRLNLQVDLLKYSLPKTTTDILVFTRKYSGNVSRELTRELPVGDYVYLFSRKGYTKRIQEYVRSEGKKAVILTDEQIKECLIDASLLIEPDTLPVYKTQRSGGTYRHKGISTYDSSYSKRWREYSGTIDASEKIYVPLDRGCTDIPGFPGSKIFNCVRFLQNQGKCPEIYGLNSSFMKKGVFKNGKWKRFDIFWQEFEKTLAKPKKFIYNESEYDLINNLARKIQTPLLKEWADLNAELENSRKIWEENGSIYTAIGLATDDDYSLDKKNKEVMDKYPMLRYLIYKAIDDYNSIQQYMEAIDDKIEA